MATVTLHVGSNMSNWNIGDLDGVTPLTENDDYFAADFDGIGNPADLFELFGSGFKYAGDDLPSKGTIETLQQSDAGALHWEIEDVSLKVSKLDQWAEAGASETAFSNMFRGADTFTGSSTQDVILAQGGADTISGGKGDDFLFSQTGDDDLEGEAGDDRLIGDWGEDIMTGCGGADRFVYLTPRDSSPLEGKRDTITDFNGAVDLIDVSLIDADTTMNGDQAFTFINANAFSNTAGELRLSDDGVSGGVDVVVIGDIDGDGAADFAVELALIPPPEPPEGDLVALISENNFIL